MVEGEHETVFDTVARRNEFLALLDEEPLDKASIVRNLGVSRSTVNRAISTLQSYGLVERVDGRYRTTSFGVLTQAHYQQTLSTVEQLTEARRLLDRADGVELPLTLFRDAAVITDEDDTHAPARFLIRLLTDATAVRSTGGIFRNGFPTSVSRRVENGGQLRMNLVLSQRTFDWARAYHEPEVCTILSSDRHGLRVVDAHRSTSVVIIENDNSASRPDTDDRVTDAPAAAAVAVVFYDDRDEPVGLIYATDRCTLDWAADYVERTWERGTQPPVCDPA